MATEVSEMIYEGDFVSQLYYPKAVFHYTLQIPKKSSRKEETGLLVMHDGFNRANVSAIEMLSETGEAPCCVCVGVLPGSLIPTVENADTRNLRMITYDVFSPSYPAFLVKELIPYLTEKYQLSFSDSPDMHLVTGGSSGGVSAWNIAWHQTDYFHRVYMSSPSFLAMGKGNELLALIRKVETKPIRVFTEYSENEPEDYFGSDFVAGLEAERALRYAGYDMMSRYYPGEGHCSRLENPESAVERMQFLWKNWKTEPIWVQKRSKRAEILLPLDSVWQETEELFPKRVKACSICTAAGEYIGENSRIIFRTADGREKVVSEAFEKITSLRISSDKWRLYIADKTKACVYAATLESDGSLSGIYYHGALHQNTEFLIPGALDMCIDSEDRLYVATELGIQCIRSFGLIDVILENPCGTPVEQLEIGEDGFLYALAGGRVYKRKLQEKNRPKSGEQTRRSATFYYD